MHKLLHNLFRSAVFTAMMAAMFIPVAAQNRSEFHETYTLNAGGTVSVSNVSGYIRVSGWDENRVKVDAVKRSDRRNEDLDKVEIQVFASPERVEIRTMYPQTRWGNTNVSVDYDIRVPRSAILNSLTSVSGDITISEVNGRVTARSTSGDISAQMLGSEAKLSSVSGNLIATKIKDVLTISSTSGDLEISDITAPLNARSVSGDIQALDISGDAQAASTSGDVILERIGGRVSARSTSGSVQVSDVGGDVEAASTSDSVTIKRIRGRATVSAISGEIQIHDVEQGARASSVSGSIEMRQIKGSVTADSTSGNVTLREIEGQEVRGKSHSGAVRYQGKVFRNGRYDFDSFSGEVVVLLPADTDFDLLAKTYNGEIETDFAVQVGAGSNLSSRNRRLQAVHGKGGAQLNLTGFSANIKLKKM